MPHHSIEAPPVMGGMERSGRPPIPPRPATSPDRGGITVVVPLPPSYRGGTEEYAYHLAKGFSRLQETRVVTTTVRWNPSTISLDTGAASVERLPARELFERPVMLSPIARARLRRAVGVSSIVNLHMPFPSVEAAATAEANRAHVPIVLTYHMDADLRAAMPGPGSSLVTSLYRRLSAHPALENCDAVVANSRGYAQASTVLSSHLSKVTVIPKGVDPERLGIGGPGQRDPPACVSGIVRSNATFRLLFVGRLVPYKGVGILLRAVEQLFRQGQKVTLMIAGNGPLRPELERQAATLDIKSRVIFVGFVPDEQMGDLYRFADLTVIPSVGVLESSATALEEAAACGCPVVGSDLPGASESIPNDGIRGRLVTPGDPSAIADAIARMMAGPRAPPPVNVRTWDDVKRDYLALFQTLGVSIQERETPKAAV